MSTRTRFRYFPLAMMMAAALSGWLQPAMAAHSSTSARRDMHDARHTCASTTGILARVWISLTS